MESSDDEDDVSSDSDDKPLEFDSTKINYILSFQITDGWRHTFIFILISLNFVSVNCAIVFMILGLFVKNSVQKQITFLQDYYQPKAVPTVLIVSGFVMFAAGALGVKASIGGKVTDSEQDAKSAALFFYAYWIAALITAVTICVATFMCFLEVHEIRLAFAKGLKSGMAMYSNGGSIKTEIDILQLEFSCCGVESYKDWYELAWIDAKYIDIKNDPQASKNMKEGKYLTKDVPFSCCRRDIFRPCVDSRIENNEYHSTYTYPGSLTIQKVGCKKAVADFLGKILKGVGGFVVVCLIVWVLLAVIGRYLHTSTMQISIGEPPVGWLIPLSKSGKMTAAGIKMPKNLKLPDFKMPKNMKLPNMPKNAKLPDIKMPQKMPKNVNMPEFQKPNKKKKKKKDMPVSFKKGNEDEDSSETVDIDFGV